MLRVLTLSTLYPDAGRPTFGGFVARQTQGLAARAGVAVQVVAPVGLPPWPLSLHPHYRARAALPRVEEWGGLPVLRPRFAALPGTGGRFHAALLARALRPVLARLRRRFAFDVIDAEFFFPDGPAAVALGRALGVPVSIKARGGDVHGWGTAPATAAQVRRAGIAADGLLAVSDALKADMTMLGMRADRIAVHRTGIDHALFHPRDRAAAKAALGLSGPVVIATGTLNANKGHHLVIRALAAVPGATLLIVGTGPDRDALARLAAQVGVADRVRLLGGVAHAALPGLLAAADVFALASAKEGLANAWVEALACGVPLVIGDAGGAREVVTGPAAGRVVARDPAAIAAAVRALLAAPPAPAAVAAFARPYDWDRNAAALHAHLAALVAGYRRG